MKRERNRRKRKELITTILEKGKGPREIGKKGCRKKITSMLKENGETTNEREEILSICSDFYKKLYAKIVEKPQDLVEKNPEQEKVPKFTDKEIENTLKSLKKGKAPGIDNITSDILKLGGKEVIKALKTIFNNILDSQEIPEMWREAKMIILHKKGERRDIKNYRPVSLLSHSINFTLELYRTEWRKCWTKINPANRQDLEKNTPQ